MKMAMTVQAEHLVHLLGIIPSITILPRYDSSPTPNTSHAFFGDRSPARTESPDSVRSENSENPEDSGGDLSFVRPSEVQLIDRIETAQLEGRIPYSPTDPKESLSNLDSGNNECFYVKLLLNQHGLKITDVQTKVSTYSKGRSP